MGRKEKDEIPMTKELMEYFQKTGRQGGRAAAQNMTPEARAERARKASRARWAKRRKA